MRLIQVTSLHEIAIAIDLTIAQCVFWCIQCVKYFGRCFRVVALILAVVADVTRSHSIQQLAAIVLAVHGVQIGFGPIRMQLFIQVIRRPRSCNDNKILFSA